jgi:hypothetical protein
MKREALNAVVGQRETDGQRRFGGNYCGCGADAVPARGSLMVEVQADVRASTDTWSTRTLLSPRTQAKACLPLPR